MENASFPSKTAISEANVKTNRTLSTKCGPITKNGVLPVTTALVFWKFCFSWRLSYKELYQLPKWLYLYFLLALEFCLTVLFPREYPKGWKMSLYKLAQFTACFYWITEKSQIIQRKISFHDDNFCVDFFQRRKFCQI